MTKECDSIAKGVAEAWDFWLANHDISTPETIERAVSETFERWALEHDDDLIRGISEAIAAKHPISGPPVAVHAVGSVTGIYAAEPGWEAISYVSSGSGDLQRFPVIAWALYVYDLDAYDRPLTRIEPMFIGNGFPALQSHFSDCEIRKVKPE